MDRRLLNYLPPVLRQVMEFRAINEANEPEISLAWDALALVLANQFLDSADRNGVAVWERELNIYPKDTDSMEVRKARIKAMWNLELPYTLPWLKHWLAGICGPIGYELAVIDYTINVQLDYNTLPDANNLAEEILEMLLTVRPSNMRVLMTAFLQSYGMVSYGAWAEMAHSMDVWPRIVSELQSTGRAPASGLLRYHATVEIYPTEQEE